MAELNLQPAAAAAAAAADESVSATSSGSKRLADSLRTSRLAPPLLLHPHPLSRLLAGSLIKSPYMIPLAKGQNPSQYHYFVIKQMPPASVTILCSDLPPPESTGSAVFAPPFSYFLWHSTKRTLRCFVSIQLFYSQAREAVKVNIIFSKRNWVSTSIYEHESHVIQSQPNTCICFATWIEHLFILTVYMKNKSVLGKELEN